MSTIKELVTRAHAAQEQIEYWSQEKVDEMVAAVGWHALQAAEECAQVAFEETAMGVYKDKLGQASEKDSGRFARSVRCEDRRAGGR